MAKLLVNALSATNPSGAHVLQGHVGKLAEALRGQVRIVVLGRADMAGLRAELGERVEWELAPAATRGWLFRAAWERRHLARILRKHGAGIYFTPSGMAAHLPPGVRQIVFCQNPWALVPAARRRRDFAKAWLQRRAYRRAMRAADVLVFNSRYMQAAYRANAGREERRGLVVYQAAEDATRARAAAADVPRQPNQILCVSVMGPHKNAETLVRALREVRAACPEAHLVFAGSWPDPAYERKIRGLVAALGLGAAVEFAGFVARERLDRLYAESRAFCLMSRCESFGIPAIEAQLFGTPVVSSMVCAIPEICGTGGLFRAPDDVAGVAAALRTVLEDNVEWARLSAAARTNAARFSWAECSRPLVDLVAELARG